MDTIIPEPSPVNHHTLMKATDCAKPWFDSGKKFLETKKPRQLGMDSEAGF